MPKVSIITPTRDRQQFLPDLWQCIKAQTMADFEWLIHDDSATPWVMPIEPDPRVLYIYQPDLPPMTIGAKRNVLGERVTGDIIVHMDDDDHYAPHYIESMLKLLDNADFAKLTGFLVYHCHSKTLGYLDLDHPFPWHYRFDPDPTIAIAPTRLLTPQPIDCWGYGFSYVYRKTVWQAIKFPEQNWNEDIGFAKQVLDRFRADHAQDWSPICLHRIHTGNMSRVFPQQILPRDWLRRLFPDLIRPPRAG